MDGQAYAVVRSENIGKLPLNFNVEENGTYSIHVDAEDIELSYLHLIDNMTGADIDLLENSCYTFEAKTTDYASRFKLVFASHDSSTIGNTFAFIDANGNIIVNGAEAGTTMQIVDMTGRVIVSIDGRTASVPTAGMTAGVYVLRLINGNNNPDSVFFFYIDGRRQSGLPSAIFHPKVQHYFGDCRHRSEINPIFVPSFEQISQSNKQRQPC